MAVCVLLPEAESWLAQQAEVEFVQPPPQPRKKAQPHANPILERERLFIEARMAADRYNADPENHAEFCAWCRQWCRKASYKKNWG